MWNARSRSMWFSSPRCWLLSPPRLTRLVTDHVSRIPRGICPLRPPSIWPREDRTQHCIIYFARYANVWWAIIPFSVRVRARDLREVFTQGTYRRRPTSGNSRSTWKITKLPVPFIWPRFCRTSKTPSANTSESRAPDFAAITASSTVGNDNAVV